MLQEVAVEVENAQEELITMDAMRAPQDKLQCVVACSKSIFRILEKSSDDVGRCTRVPESQLLNLALVAGVGGQC
jgi:hypothetical protein